MSSRIMTSASLHFRLLIAGTLSILLVGCGGKGSTNLSYTAPVAPLGISFSIDKDGSWSASAGIATPVGTFAISHTFESRDSFTYIVLRNRQKGTDQVFKIGATGYVDLHAIGEHKIRMEREDNRWIIDTETISGTLDVQVYPSNSAIARVDFGKDYPDAVVTTDHKLILEYPSIWTTSKSIPLDSIKSIELSKRWLYGQRSLYLQWRDGLPNEPISVDITPDDSAETNFQSLQAGIAKVSPHVQFTRATYWLGSIAQTFVVGFVIIGILGWFGSKG